MDVELVVNVLNGVVVVELVVMVGFNGVGLAENGVLVVTVLDVLDMVVVVVELQGMVVELHGVAVVPKVVPDVLNGMLDVLHGVMVVGIALVALVVDLRDESKLVAEVVVELEVVLIIFSVVNAEISYLNLN